MCSAAGSRTCCPSAALALCSGFRAGWESDPTGEQPGRRGGLSLAPIKMLDTDLRVKRQGNRRPFHRACCSPQKGGFQGRGAGMRAAAGGQSRHHCPLSLGEGVMLTQGFLPAKGVRGRVFPPSLRPSPFPWLNSAATEMPGYRSQEQIPVCLGVLYLPQAAVSKGGRFLLLITGLGSFALLARRNQQLGGCEVERRWIRRCPSVVIFACSLSHRNSPGVNCSGFWWGLCCRDTRVLCRTPLSCL